MTLSEDRRKSFEHLLLHLREPLLLATRAGRILASNVAGADALGTSVAALDGASLSSYSPEPARIGALLLAVPVGEASAAFPLRARDGRRFFGDASALDPDTLLVRLSGGPEAEPRVRVFHETLSRLQGLAAGVDARTIEEITRALLTQAMASLGAISAGVFLVDETGANLELKGSVGYGEEYDDRFRLFPLTVALPITDAFNKGAAVLLGAPEDFTSLYAEFTSTHPDIAKWAIACVPLELDGRSMGVIGMGFPMPWAFSDDDRVFLQALALRCAQLLDRTRLSGSERASRELVERSASQLARLHAFTGALAQAISLAQVVEAVVDMGLAATSARSGGLWILSDDGATVSLVRSVGTNGPTTDQYANVPLDRPDRMPILDSIRSGSPIWIESCRQMEEQYPAVHRAFSRGGESSLACVPSFAQGRCIGGLVFNYEGVHRFLEDERAFLQVLSWHSAQAIERSRLYAAEKSARAAAEANHQRSEFLADTGTILASSLDYLSTLASVARAAVPRVADWCIVELEEARLGGVPAVAAHTDPSKVPFVQQLSRRFRELSDTEHGIPGVIRSGKSELCESIAMSPLRQVVSADPELGELFRQAGLASSMVVPISARGRTLGAILLSSANDARLYSEVDLAMAEELGRRAGVAVDNARLYRDAREADQRKDEFLAMLGHELRNPLAPILTALELMDLRGGKAFAQERTTISRQVQHVVRLVDDLLDVSRITSGNIQLRKERIEVSEVIAEAVEMASPLFEERFQDLTISAPAQGLPVVADRGRLSQAIANLLTNAAKYTEPRGKIALTASVEGEEVLVSVRDSGIGIAADTLPNIFNLFVQGKGSLDRAKGGLGIGLTVVRSLVRLHGGSVLAQSAGLGLGSEFVIRLPLRLDHAPEAQRSAVQSRADRPEQTPQRRVLIVDDNADAARMLSALLETFGYTTQVASDGPSALAVAPRFKPDVALLDIGLPVMDGYELARRLRRTEFAAATRLVAITGYGQASDRRNSREAGFDEHLVKPVNVDTLLKVLRRLEEDGAAAG